MVAISEIRKRDGTIVVFDPSKIEEAIWKAAKSVGEEDRSISANLTKQIVSDLEKHFEPGKMPTVEQVQDCVEKSLIRNGKASMAKAYILYRQKRAKIRRMATLLGVKDELKLPLNSILVLERRYLRKNVDGIVIESTSQMFRRIAKSVAQVEKQYGKVDREVTNYENEFLLHHDKP